jgi:hypothetical protein
LKDHEFIHDNENKKSTSTQANKDRKKEEKKTSSTTAFNLKKKHHPHHHNSHAISSSPDTTKKSVGPEAPEWHFHWSARPPETSPLGPSSLAVLGRSELEHYLGPMCLACMRSLKDLRQGLPWLSEWIMWIHKIAFLGESRDQP